MIASPSSSPAPLTFSRALVRRIAAYVRGFTVPPPSGVASSEWHYLQHVADMIEAQEHALIESTPLESPSSSPAPQAWLPIETAPKDADALLLWGDGWGVQPGYWDHEVGWLACETQGLTGGKFKEATHWMALPAPPSAALAVAGSAPRPQDETLARLRRTLCFVKDYWDGLFVGDYCPTCSAPTTESAHSKECVYWQVDHALYETSDLSRAGAGSAPPPLKTRHAGNVGHQQTPFYVFEGTRAPEYDQGDCVVVWYDDLYDLANPRSAVAGSAPAPPEVERALTFLEDRANYYNVIHTAHCQSWKLGHHENLLHCTCAVGKALETIRLALSRPPTGSPQEPQA
jgi:hypothetical protein